MQIRALVERARAELRFGRAPAHPPGWRTGPPDFIGLGAQRSGTTWWHHLISSHPGVHPGVAKELHLLRRYWKQPFDDVAAAEYAAFFPRPPGQLVGEWSPGYLSHFWVSALLPAAAPGALHIVMVRDPVERYRSGLSLQARTRRSTFSAASAAFRLGCYGLQLEHLYGYVDRARVLVLQFERCILDPATELARTYRFLGLDDGYTPPDLCVPRNQSRRARPPLPDQVRDALAHAYAPDVDRLVALVQGIDVELWPSFAARTTP